MLLNKNTNLVKLTNPKGLKKHQLEIIKKKYVLGNNSNEAIFYLRQTLNNFAFTVTDLDGRVIFSYSGGKTDVKRSIRGSHQAAVEAINILIYKLLSYRINRLTIVVKSNLNFFMQSALNTLFQTKRFKIKKLLERKPLPHNGMRRKKLRRI